MSDDQHAQDAITMTSPTYHNDPFFCHSGLQKACSN